MKTIPLLLALLLAGCASRHEAVLLPQTDSDYKVLAEGSDLEAARAAAESEADIACRPQGSRKAKLLEESRPEQTPEGRVRIRWRFSCEKQPGY